MKSPTGKQSVVSVLAKTLYTNNPLELIWEMPSFHLYRIVLVQCH